MFTYHKNGSIGSESEGCNCEIKHGIVQAKEHHTQHKQQFKQQHEYNGCGASPQFLHS